LVAKLGNTAHIEVDKLREFVDFMPLTKELIAMNLKNAALVANTFIENGLNVVISYPLSTENYNLLTGLLSLPKKDIFTFTLNPKLQAVLKNRGGRELDDWEVERIKHYYSIGINSPKFGSIVIDNTDQSPEKTTAEIFKYLKNS
jgi:hypothetical protein